MLLRAPRAYATLTGLKATFPLDAHLWLDCLKLGLIADQQRLEGSGGKRGRGDALLADRHEALASRVRELEKRVERGLAQAAAAGGVGDTAGDSTAPMLTMVLSLGAPAKRPGATA